MNKMRMTAVTHYLSVFLDDRSPLPHFLTGQLISSLSVDLQGEVQQINKQTQYGTCRPWSLRRVTLTQ